MDENSEKALETPRRDGSVRHEGSVVSGETAADNPSRWGRIVGVATRPLYFLKRVNLLRRSPLVDVEKGKADGISVSSSSTIVADKKEKIAYTTLITNPKPVLMTKRQYHVRWCHEGCGYCRGPKVVGDEDLMKLIFS